jgi:hypothetical protein
MMACHNANSKACEVKIFYRIYMLTVYQICCERPVLVTAEVITYLRGLNMLIAPVPGGGISLTITPGPQYVKMLSQITK